MTRWVLYFIQEAGSGNVKIGIARDIKKRIYELQTGNHNKLTLLGLAKFESEYAVRRTEAKVHKMFDLNHVRGEWFRPTEDLLRIAKTAI